MADDVAAKPKRTHRSPHGPGLFVTDAEMAELLGVPAKIVGETVRSLDKNSASRFPKKHPLWGGRRYWPAVQKWIENNYGIRDKR